MNTKAPMKITTVKGKVTKEAPMKTTTVKGKVTKEALMKTTTVKGKVTKEAPMKTTTVKGKVAKEAPMKTTTVKGKVAKEALVKTESTGQPSDSVSMHPVGTMMRGSDRKNWVLITKNKKKEWVHLGTVKKRCEIQDSGYVPFLVTITDKRILVHRLDDNGEPNKLHLHITEFEKVLTGGADDHVVLVHLGNLRYLSIGATTTEFTSDEEIKKFNSRLTRNGIAYPYAMTDSKVYFVEMDMVHCVEKNKVFPKERSTASDPYDIFHDKMKRFTLDAKDKKRVRTKTVIKRAFD